jgi:hypothetical protein
MVGSTRALKAIPKDALERLWTGKETRLTVSVSSSLLRAMGSPVPRSTTYMIFPSF